MRYVISLMFIPGYDVEAYRRSCQFIVKEGNLCVFVTDS